MVSLWGSKKDDDDNEQHNGNGEDMPRDSDDNARAPPSRREYERREARETDRLLPSNPRPPHADGYLDPDDPAVS